MTHLLLHQPPYQLQLLWFPHQLLRPLLLLPLALLLPLLALLLLLLALLMLRKTLLALPKTLPVLQAMPPRKLPTQPKLQRQLLQPSHKLCLR